MTKTITRLETIPQELCTMAEAKRILGLSTGFRLDSPRYKHLRFSYVNLNGYCVQVFNRAEIEALKLPDGPPAGYVDLAGAAQLLGFSKGTQGKKKADRWLKDCNILARVFNSKKNHRAHNIYRIGDVKRVAAIKGNFGK